MLRDLLLVLTVAGLVVGGVGMHATAQDADEFEVLVYTRTGGFRHASIVEGVVAINELGLLNGFSVAQSEDPDMFTDEHLARFAAVIFLNTTGDVMTDEGRAAFERYVRGGGGWVGIHSAADTEYDWAFYGELLAGAYFLSHPIQQPGELEVEVPDHPSTAHLSERWFIPFEEFYSFQHNPRTDVRVLLSIDEDTYEQDPNTTHLPSEEHWMPPWPEGETGVMGDHPMAWCHDVGDGHAWYTALGHEGWLYRSPDYREHILGGILTAAGQLDADCAVEAAEAPPPEPDTSPPGDAPPAEPPPPQAGEALPATGAAGALLALTLLAFGFAVRTQLRP